jgi:hypothetical protein
MNNYLFGKKYKLAAERDSDQAQSYRGDSMFASYGHGPSAC